MSEQQHKYFRLIEGPPQLGDFISEDGKLVEICNSSFTNPFNRPVFRPIPAVDEWVAYSERKPTKEDGSKVDVVLESGFIGQYLSDVGLGWGSVTHWRRITPPTPVVQPILVDGKELKFNSDGSVKVGCTTIPADQMDDIIKRREAARGVK